MIGQDYPDKAPFKNYKLIKASPTDKEIKEQFMDWHNEHPSYAVTQHQYVYNDGIEALYITYIDLDEAEKDIDPEYRGIRNVFYFDKFEEPLTSGESVVTKWYNDNDVDILSKISAIDVKKQISVTGIVSVNRKEAQEAYNRKRENEQKQRDKMAKELAIKSLTEEKRNNPVNDKIKKKGKK